MKGTRFPSEFRPVEQPESGKTLWQLTAAPCINHATYFLQSSVAPDGRTMVFTSYRSGSAQLFAIEDWPAGSMVQWTDSAAIHPFSAAFHPNGRDLYFVRGGAIWRMNWRTLEERLVFDAAPAQLGEVSLSRDGDWVTAAGKRENQHGLLVVQISAAYASWIPFPRTVIHPQFHPLEPEWIEFAGDPAPRMHRVRRDGTGLECLYEHGNEEFVVHETFLGDTGDLVYTIWPHSLWRMNWQTRQRTLIAEINAWHITPDRAGRRILCDTNHPDRGLLIIDSATGQVRPLCLTQSSNAGSQWRRSTYAMPEDFAAARANQTGTLSWMESATDTVYGPQWTHPHPSFTPEERHVIFTSDFSGHPQIYAVELT